MTIDKPNLHNIYLSLLEYYGPQGWWPLIDVNGINPTKTGSTKGYHPADFDYPKNDNQRFEISIGAILTQNTNWVNVEKSLSNLHQNNALSLESIQLLDDEQLKELIRPAGYYNQKTKKIRFFCELLNTLNNTCPTREQLLSVWGIGPETADSILLYAWQKPVFVIDAYTTRIVSHLNIVSNKPCYHEIQHLFHQSLPADWKLFQEYHALLVEHAKHFYSKKPWGSRIDEHGNLYECFLLNAD